MRTIIITGASGGLAQEMVKLLPCDQLILVGRSKEKLEKLYGESENIDLVELDITDSSALERFAEWIDSQYGHVDVLVNNAGYGIFEEFDKISSSDIEAMFEVNTFALMNLSRLFGSRMKKAGQGHIINIVSMAGLISSSKSSLYSATKFAAIGFSNALRLELKTAFFDLADPDGSYVKAVDKYILEPDFVAGKIVSSFGKKKREINLPWILNLAHKFYTLFPRIADKLAAKMFNYK